MFWKKLMVHFTNFVGKLFFNLTYEGLENIPDKAGFVVVSNHRSYADPFVIGAKLYPRNLSFMAKKELFKNPLVAGFIKYFGAFAVDRGAGDTEALDYAVASVKKGDVLCIFPEGTRSQETEMKRFKSGAAHIISQVGADVIPVAVDFHGKLRLGNKVTVKFGKVKTCEELGLSELSLAAVKKASRVLHDAVDEMLVLTK